MYLRVRIIISLLTVGLVLAGADADADPVAVRFSEGVAHGFVVLRGERGEVLADGELIQTSPANGVQSRLVFRFKDGSRYDETVTFSQKGVFRLLAYKLVQQGPAFSETSEVAFDRAGGRYRARAGEDTSDGTVE